MSEEGEGAPAAAASAAASEEALRYLWLSVAIVLFIVTALCLTVPLGILTSPSARRNSFNLYLVFLMVPDVFFTGMCTITCSFNYAVGHYYSATMCEFQNWYTVFGVSGNAWLNAVVCRQLHTMLSHSYQRRRYHAPTRKRVGCHAGCVYLYSAAIASVTFFAVSPEANDAMMKGAIACFPTKYDSALVFWLFFCPAFFAVPLVYILGVCFDVYRRGLLPRTGRTRVLAMYFFRLVTIFIVMWIPYFIITMSTSNPWGLLAGGMWGHLQIVTSAAFSLTKPDVRDAVLELLRLKEREELPKDSSTGEPVQRRRSSLLGITLFGSTTATTTRAGSIASYFRRGSGCNAGGGEEFMDEWDDDVETFATAEPGRRRRSLVMSLPESLEGGGGKDSSAAATVTTNTTNSVSVSVSVEERNRSIVEKGDGEEEKSEEEEAVRVEEPSRQTAAATPPAVLGAASSSEQVREEGQSLLKDDNGGGGGSGNGGGGDDCQQQQQEQEKRRCNASDAADLKAAKKEVEQEQARSGGEGRGNEGHERTSRPPVDVGLEARRNADDVLSHCEESNLEEEEADAEPRDGERESEERKTDFDVKEEEEEGSAPPQRERLDG